MFVVHFVRSPDTPQIDIIRIPEKPESLMYENIMYKKIGDPVQRDPYAYPEERIISIDHSEYNPHYTRY